MDNRIHKYNLLLKLKKSLHCPLVRDIYDKTLFDLQTPTIGIKSGTKRRSKP